ncbi:MAG: DUF4129 domain-containing protein [Balneolales bacterium]|nr:DUF4129 domain-containing protein [Balneolales bacterium]
MAQKILFGATFFLLVAAGNAMSVTGGQTFPGMMVFSSVEGGSNVATNVGNVQISYEGSFLATEAYGASLSAPNTLIASDSLSDGQTQDSLDVQLPIDTLTVYVSSPPDTIIRITTTSADRIESYRNRHDFAQIEESRLSIWDLITYWFRTLTSALPDNEMIRFLVYLIVGALLLYLISWLVYRSFNSTHFRQNKVAQFGDAGGRFSSDSGGANPEDLLQSGDFRNAIRLMLIDSLQNLASEKMIALDKDKTNRDYLYELPEGALREHFSTLSRIYNYVWYGDFEPAQFQVDAAQNAWKQLVSKEVR